MSSTKKEEDPGCEPSTLPKECTKSYILPQDHGVLAYTSSLTNNVTIFLFLRKTLTRRFLVVPDVIVEFAPLLTSLPFGIDETDADSRMLDMDGSETLRGTPFWKRTTRPD